jgi:branched-chain amino acid transport system ATP-binding protein
MLGVNRLTASYSGIEALRSVSLGVERGEMVALIGPNGAGKSTLLNCLSGIVAAKTGSVKLEGVEMLGRRPAQISRTGLLHVPEGRQILADLTVEENLQLGQLALGGRSPDWDLDRVRRLFPILGQRRTQRAGSLSGGEQQMLAIGRALMGAPKVLLLDEPSLGLSPIMADVVFAALRGLNAEGLTVLLVEQNARRALDVTTRAYVLEQGRIVREGQSASLASDPRVIEHYLGAVSEAQDSRPRSEGA